jgi:hypothetical protein
MTEAEIEQFVAELMDCRIDGSFDDEEKQFVAELMDCWIDGSFDDEEKPEVRLQRRVDALALRHGCSEEQAQQWLSEEAESTGQQTERRRQDDEELLALLDGPFRVLRDNTFSDPDRLLVWDKQAKPVIQSLTFDEATKKYECGGYSSQWAPEDLDRIKEEKHRCISETYLANVFHETGIEGGDIACGTPVLIINSNPLLGHTWKEVKAHPD